MCARLGHGTSNKNKGKKANCKRRAHESGKEPQKLRMTHERQAFEREFKAKDESRKETKGTGSRAAEVWRASRRSRLKHKTAFHHFLKLQKLLYQSHQADSNNK